MGEIDAAWDTPTQAPLDYHITWAKVGEDFPSAEEKVGNAFPKDTSYKITSLLEGSRYKVKVRARYSDSFGEWTEPEEVQVMVAPTATNTPIPPTNTPVPTATNTATATATSSEFCVLVGPGTFWLFPASRFLSGQISVYPGDTCGDFEISLTSIGEDGYVYTSSGQSTAENLCAAGHNDGSTFSRCSSACQY